MFKTIKDENLETAISLLFEVFEILEEANEVRLAERVSSLRDEIESAMISQVPPAP